MSDKSQSQRPRFNLVSAFIAALGVKAIQAKQKEKLNNDNPETESEFKYAGLGAFYGAPIYTPKRTKFKGYMRNESYKAKHKRS